MKATWVIPILLAGCGGHSTDSASTSGPHTRNTGVSTAEWVQMSGCGMTFQAPPDVVEQPVQGIDSCVMQHSTEACQYWSDVGWYSNDLSGSEVLAEYVGWYEDIDGRSAKLVTAFDNSVEERPYLAAIHFAMANPDTGEFATMSASCRTESGVVEALTLFGTIRFQVR